VGFSKDVIYSVRKFDTKKSWRFMLERLLMFAEDTLTILFLAPSFLDLKTTVQPEKLKIPDECKQAAISQRSIPAMIQKLRMKTAMKRMFPLMFEALHARRKRRFPWVVPKLHKIRNRK